MGIKLLLYGPSGTGKTHFAWTAGPRTAYIEVGKHALTGQLFDYKMAFHETVFIKASELSRDYISEIREVLKKAFDDLNSWDTLVIDELTSLGLASKLRGLKINDELGVGDKSKGWFKKAEVLKAVLMHPSDWGTAIGVLDSFLSEVCRGCDENDKNVILLAHERIEFAQTKLGEDRKRARTYIGTFGQTFPDTVPNYFNYVWHTSVEGKGKTKRYFIRTEGEEGLYGKTEGKPYELDLDVSRDKEGKAKFTFLEGVVRRNV